MCVLSLNLVLSVFSVRLGGVVIPSTGGGTFFGGYIVKRLNLRCRGIIRFCITCALVSLLTVFIFFIHCPTVSMAGVTVPYRASLVEEYVFEEFITFSEESNNLRLRNRFGLLQSYTLKNILFSNTFIHFSHDLYHGLFVTLLFSQFYLHLIIIRIWFW